MQLKHTSSGLTLIEIMLSLIVASLILLYLIPQQLKSTREQMINQTIAEMNQIVLAARNYYQDQYNAAPTSVLATLWPQILGDLSANNYLPPAALCSPWPSSSSNATCGYHVPYTIFPANAANAYDKTAVGIAAASPNAGGNFWGVSITLPNAAIAQAVEQKLPFSTLCDTTQLKTGAACTSANTTTNTVTAIVPRPAQWSTQVNYATDGLIQSIGAFKICYDGSIGEGTKNLTNKVLACVDPSYTSVVTHYIPMPTCSAGTKSAVFVYLSILQPYKSGDSANIQDNTTAATISSAGSSTGYGNYYPGISVRTTRDDANNRWVLWVRIASDTRNKSIGPKKFHHLRADYFTTCSPNNDFNKWDPSNFLGINGNSSYELLWPASAA